MSTEIKESFLDKQMTRRQFLKISGKSLAGLTVSATLLSLFGCSMQEIEDQQVSVWAIAQGLLVVNAAKCTGCERCEINCTLVNDGEASTYISRVKVSRNLHIHGKEGMYNRNFTYYPDTCRQCKDPACGNACPKDAIVTNAMGIRTVDEGKCIGCGACVEACPWHMPTVNKETGKSSKCIACGECAKGCPSGALQIVSWDEITAAAQKVV